MRDVGVSDLPSDRSEPGTHPSEGTALRFLRWLIEPPAGPQTPAMRVLRWVLRAVGFVLRALIGDGSDGPNG